ncbi:MAG: type IV toxin-antitoxin system AbiEi family antitoxin domain-containing protein [Candidatus Dormibacteria bacterium]
MASQLELIDSLVAAGKEEFTFEDAGAALGRSPSATANTLRRLQDNGLVDRLGRGRYAIRPLGSLHTSATTDDLALAVGATFAARWHRIAYLSALADLGLLSHPVRTVTVACTHQVRAPAISRRPLRVVVERAETIHLEADRIGHSWRSTLERALFECALRIDLSGGIGRLAEALANGSGDTDPTRVSLLAQVFGPRGLAAERRLASLAQVLELPLHLAPAVASRQPVVHLDPRDEHVIWVDDTFRVAWNLSADELQAVVRN